MSVLDTLELFCESIKELSRKMEEIFLERGILDEVLLDNGASFRSVDVKNMCEKWNVDLNVRAVFRGNYNGIIERNHRMVKRIATRSDISIQEAVFWYNFLPREVTSEESCPYNGIFKYKWRINNTIRWLEEEEEEEEGIKNKFSIGDSVWVKPGITRCTVHRHRRLGK